MRSYLKINYQFKLFIFGLIFFTFFQSVSAQSFYQEKEPKVNFYRFGIGAGTYFSAPRPSYDRIENQVVPTITLGVGRKYRDHFSLRAATSFQQFKGNEILIQGDTEVKISEPIFNGYNYTFELSPTFNLFPAYHHMSRPIIDVNAGVGIGYLLTYRTETFVFRERSFDFSYFKSAVYIPLRLATVFKVGKLTDIEIEGVFLYTFLNNSDTKSRLEKDSDHFGQLNLVYRKYFGRVR